MSSPNDNAKSHKATNSEDPLSSNVECDKDAAELNCLFSNAPEKVGIKCLEAGEEKERDLCDDDGLDRGYCWVILLCGAIFQLMSVGVTLSSGVLVVEFRSTYDASPLLASLMGAMNCGLAFASAPFGSFISNGFSHRVSIMTGCFITSLAMVCSSFSNSGLFLLISYGVIAGLGLGLVYSPSISVVGLYFRKKRPFALGITVAGGALGPIVLPPLFRWSVDTYSWRGVFILLAGLTMQCCVFAALLRPVKYLTKQPISCGHNQHCRRSSTWREITNVAILFDPTFFIQLLNNLLWSVAISQLWILLPDYANESGMSKTQGAILISLASFGNAFGRGLAAFVMHLCPNMNRLNFHNISTIFGGIFLASYPIYQDIYYFASISCLVGIMYGLLVGSLPVITSDLYGVEKLTSAFGYLMVADGLGFAIGPPFAGWLFDLSKSYDIPFICAGIIYALSGIIMFFTVCTKKCKSNAI